MYSIESIVQNVLYSTLTMVVVGVLCRLLVVWVLVGEREKALTSVQRMDDDSQPCIHLYSPASTLHAVPPRYSLLATGYMYYLWLRGSL